MTSWPGATRNHPNPEPPGTAQLPARPARQTVAFPAAEPCSLGAPGLRGAIPTHTVSAGCRAGPPQGAGRSLPMGSSGVQSPRPPCHPYSSPRCLLQEAPQEECRGGRQSTEPPVPSPRPPGPRLTLLHPQAGWASDVPRRQPGSGPATGDIGQVPGSGEEPAAAPRGRQSSPSAPAPGHGWSRPQCKQDRARGWGGGLHRAAQGALDSHMMGSNASPATQKPCDRASVCPSGPDPASTSGGPRRPRLDLSRPQACVWAPGTRGCRAVPRSRGVDPSPRAAGPAAPQGAALKRLGPQS